MKLILLWIFKIFKNRNYEIKLKNKYQSLFKHLLKYNKKIVSSKIN